ncbi:hypothetical protein [Halogeometricum luteum]|uniref:Halobacterial output domain-containing protein n=1 Tax=Halogeometricum luteum TaxID=2950537 RepID=A0ABU2FZL8_9EURY|nr:hypothetical protein [Halogeometricum sp. S3BR5-2]MDS0293988.1 hypothetical protein [Halogeometricum sp. S3BR5-2]
MPTTDAGEERRERDSVPAPSPAPDREAATETTAPDDDAAWRAVGRHRFDRSDELDATLTTALDFDGRRPTRVRGVDTEEAERLLASAREAGVELVVRFCIDDRLVRIDSEGVVAVRTDD